MTPSRDVSQLVAIMAALRDAKTGCAWDLAQSHRTLAPYALEEAYEVVDAIERGDMDDLRDELGDLLLQVVFHARLAEESDTFDFGGVVEAVTAKMVRRHPDVFAHHPERHDGQAADRVPASVSTRAWEAIKAEERRAKGLRPDCCGVLASVPATLPALTRAAKLQTKAAQVGFDWDDARLILAKIREEVDEVACEVERNGTNDALTGEIGDVIFAVVNLARHSGIDPETALRTTNVKFERRFAFIEQQLAASGTPVATASLAEMDALWDLAKARGL